ncbi:MAG: hypothetical protein ACKVT0_23820 [Planctomycetaceae bacterium]
MRRGIFWVLCTAWFVSVNGCVVFESVAEVNRQMWRSLRPKPFDMEPGKGGDEWNFVGDEARGDQPKEQDPDRWYKALQSEKARAIERNVGIE